MTGTYQTFPRSSFPIEGPQPTSLEHVTTTAAFAALTPAQRN